jgi:hypothetical protein
LRHNSGRGSFICAGLLGDRVRVHPPRYSLNNRESRRVKKEKQGFRLASFAPILTPFALFPKPGFGNLSRKASQFFKGCRYKMCRKIRFFEHLF